MAVEGWSNDFADEEYVHYDLRYVAAEEYYNPDTGANHIRWCAGWSTPRTLDYVAHALFGERYASGTYLVSNFPPGSWDNCMQDNGYLERMFFGPRPLANTPPSVHLCIGPEGSGKTFCGHVRVPHVSTRFKRLDDFKGRHSMALVDFLEMVRPSRPTALIQVHINSRLDPRDWYDYRQHEWDLVSGIFDSV